MHHSTAMTLSVTAKQASKHYDNVSGYMMRGSAVFKCNGFIMKCVSEEKVRERCKSVKCKDKSGYDE